MRFLLGGSRSARLFPEAALSSPPPRYYLIPAAAVHWHSAPSHSASSQPLTAAHSRSQPLTAAQQLALHPLQQTLPKSNMKATLLVLVALAVTAVSARAHPVETLSQDSQEVAGQIPELTQQVAESSVQERVRRSPDDKDKSRGSVSGGVHREPGVGTVVQAQGQGNIWTSKDGNGRVDAHGQWSKVVNGPGRGKPNYSGGITYTHRF